MKTMKLRATRNREVSEREKKNADLARTVAAEGFVLLKNDGVLPLQKDKAVALYGSGARMTVVGGTGSGAMHQRYSVSIEDGLKNAGVRILSQNWLDRFDRFYRDSYAAWKDGIEEKVKGIMEPFAVLGVAIANKFMYPTGIPIQDEDLSCETDTAVYVLARQAGEGNDRFDKKGDFQIDDLEYENLKKISGYYKKVVLIVNVGGLIDLSFMEEIRIDAVLFYGQGGMEGGNALADILTGRKSPSGKLACTWAKKLSDYPSTAAFSRAGDPKMQNYNEGIFVGYRYFDSFDVAPYFPFGFGLSYTAFEIKAGLVRQKASQIMVEVSVKNKGNFAGKEVVQLYVSVPRRACNAEYQRLVAFYKTKELSPGETEKFTLCFDFAECACYYPETASFILNRGYYTLRLGNSSKNTSPIAALHLISEIVTEECINVCRPREKISEISPGIPEDGLAVGVKSIAVNPLAIRTKKHVYSEPFAKSSGNISRLIKTLSDDELISLVVGSGLHSRNLVNVLGASGNTTSELYDKYGIPNVVLSDGPAGLNVSPEIVQTETGEVKSTQMYPQYDYGMFGQMLRKKLGKPEDGVMHYQYATAWPAEIVSAQTWNTDLLEAVGRAVGDEMMEFGVTVWLAPGINLYRNPLCGRVFEYYSEDPLVAGKMAAALIKGVQSHQGLGVSLKHFACNNSEVDRDLSSSNVNERALREVYLKGFEIAIRESAPKTVMASYNKINGVYNTNNYDLLVKVLRNEWGFEGLVMSDWNAVDVDRGDPCIAMKAQCDLLMPGKPVWAKILAEGLQSGTVTRSDLQRSAARVLGLVSENPFVPIAESKNNE